MEFKKIWQTLGIEPIKDEDVIRQAYRDKLVHTNPEDDAEGFKQLRESYEQAMDWAKTEEVEEASEETPVGLWMASIKQDYQNITKRCSEDCWHKHLSDPICQALDSNNEACEALLAFLMEYYYLPRKIWEMIDHTFCIVEIKESLYEKFPKNFIDYVIRCIQQDSFIDFELFEGPEDGEYDDFIRAYCELKDQINGGDMSAAEKTLSDLEQMTVSHPALRVEKLRIAINKDDKEAMKKLVEEIEAKGVTMSYASYYMGVAKNKLGDRAGAEKILRQLLEDGCAEKYGAKFELVKCDLEKGDYKEARQYALDLMDVMGNQQAVLPMLTEANKKLLEAMEKEWQQKSDEEKKASQDLRFEMAWCYFQDGDYDQCEALLTEGTDPEHEFEYNNLKGRNYLAAQKFKEAEPYLLMWLEGIKHLKEDGTEETRKRMERKDYAYYMLACCYENLDMYDQAEAYLMEGRQQKGDEKKILDEKLADMYFTMKEYTKCVDVCTEMLQEDEGLYAAYLCREKAYYQLRDGQNVIDDFYRCYNIYPGYYEPYLWAMKVFIHFNQIEDAMNIYQKAQESHVESMSLDLYYHQCQRISAENREQIEKTIAAFQKMEEKIANGEKGDLKEPSEVICEIALCYHRIYRDKEALEIIKEALKEKRVPRYVWIQADIYMRLNKYQEALRLYSSLIADYTDNAEIYFDKGDALFRLGRNEEAVSELLKALELYPQHPSANSLLSDIYKDRYDDSERIEDYQLAVSYGEKQLENNSNCYYYVEQGLVYLEGHELEKAIHAFQKALEYDPNDIYAYNNMACAYKMEEQYKESLKMAEKAISLMKDNETPLPYYNASLVYLILKQYDKALVLIKEAISRFPSSMKCRRLMEEIYSRMGRHQEEQDCYNKDFKDKLRTAAEYYGRLGEVYRSKKQYIQALYYYKQAILSEPGNSKTYSDYGEFLFLSLRWYKMAEHYLLKGLEVAGEDADSAKNICFYLCRLYGAQKKTEKAKKYLEQAIEKIQVDHPSLEDYLAYTAYSPARYYDMGMCYLAIGDREKAKECFTKMAQLPKCKSCHYQNCYEALIGRGLILEAEGKIDEARECFRRVLLEEPCDSISRYKIKKLKNS